MSEKIVVIGSNSFSGASFVAHALAAGATIIGTSRSCEPDPVFLPYRRVDSTIQKRFRFHQLDLNRDLDILMEIIDKFRPDYVVNFAAQSMVAESWQNPDHWMQTNVVATIKLHDRLRHCNYLKKYLHISTPEVYGYCEGLVKEHSAYNPSTPYAVSRAAADMSLMTFFRSYHFPVIFTRAANVFGPCQQLYRIIPRTILYFLTGKKLMLHGGGDSVRSFIHIRDVADGTLRAAHEGAAGEIYHFSTTRNISIRAVVAMIAEQLNVSFAERVEVTGDRLGKDSAYLLDSSKAREELGWEPRITLEQGIEETIAWVRDNLEELCRQPSVYLHKP